MTRHAWIVTVGAGLLVSLVPGCTLFSGATTKPATVNKPAGAKDYPLVQEPRWPVDSSAEEAQRVPANTLPTAGTSRPPYSPSLLTESPYRSVKRTQTIPQSEALFQQDPSSLLAPGETPEATPGSAPSAPPTSPVEKKPAKPDEPIVLALQSLMNDRPQEALEYLKHYDACNQEALICLTAMVARLTKKKLDNPAEAAALQDQLQKSLLAALRQRADLVIEEMCFCERIEDYRNYRRLPDDYEFRPTVDNQPGEQVQVYVEFRNLTSQRRGDGYETTLHCTMRIFDAGGKEVVPPRDLREQEGSFHTFTPLPDYYKPYSFYVPTLAPGKYLLRFEVRDVTRPEAPRVAFKTLEFRVAAVADAS